MVDSKARGVSKSVENRPGLLGPRCCARYLRFGAFGTVQNCGGGARPLVLLPLPGFSLAISVSHLVWSEEGVSLWDACKLLDIFYLLDSPAGSSCSFSFQEGLFLSSELLLFTQRILDIYVTSCALPRHSAASPVSPAYFTA